ncbi:cellulase family glycosylhydrolase [bacterium]|nr:cellulase family glycosylhydrolase [bacterium]
MNTMSKINYSKQIQVLACLATMIIVNPLFSQAQLVGVNLAGADFGEGNLPGVYNVDYTYPTRSEIDYFTDKGMNVFRLPFRWERLQHSQFADFNTEELARLDSFVNYATEAGASVILDPHNYARYYGEIIGSDTVPVTAFEDFWSRLALHYMDNPDIIFGLINEPHSMTSELWRDDANAAIAAIRATGATQLIMVPGNGWSGAHSWTQNWYGTPNSVTMLTIVDPLDNLVFEVHQYLDDDSSGTSPDCSGTTVGSQRIHNFTNWLQDNGKRGFLGEFGVTNDAICLYALDNMLDSLDAHSDVWLGWTWWAAGPWWGDYMYSLEPSDGVDKPQMAYLEEHISEPSGVDVSLPREFNLSQNFPNPFNGETRIAFDLVESGLVSLDVYDLQGHEVAALVSQNKTPGRYTVSFNAGDLPTGVYFYQIQAGNDAAVKKMLLLR